MKRDDILFIKEILRNLLFLSQQVTESPCCTFLVTAASPPWAYLCPISAVIDFPTTHETFSLILQSDLKVTAKICSLSGTNSITSVEALIPNLLSIGQPAQLPDYNTFITSLITTSSVKITIHNLCFLSSNQLQSQQVLFFMTLSLAMLLPLLLVLKEMLSSWTASSCPKTLSCVDIQGQRQGPCM